MKFINRKALVLSAAAIALSPLFAEAITVSGTVSPDKETIANYGSAVASQAKSEIISNAKDSNAKGEQEVAALMLFAVL